MEWDDPLDLTEEAADAMFTEWLNVVVE